MQTHSHSPQHRLLSPKHPQPSHPSSNSPAPPSGHNPNREYITLFRRRVSLKKSTELLIKPPDILGAIPRPTSPVSPDRGKDLQLPDPGVHVGDFDFGVLGPSEDSQLVICGRRSEGKGRGGAPLEERGVRGRKEGRKEGKNSREIQIRPRRHHERFRLYPPHSLLKRAIVGTLEGAVRDLPRLQHREHVLRVLR